MGTACARKSPAPWGGRAKKKAFVPVKGRRPRKHFAVPPVTCVPTYALPVTGDTGRAYFPRFGVRPAAQEGYSDFRATSFGLSPSRIAAGFRRSYCLHHRHCDWLCLIEDIIRTGRGLVKAQIPLFSRKKGPFLVRYSCPAWPEKIQGAGCTSISSFRPTLETSSCITSVGWMPFSQSIPGIRLMKLNSKV